MSQKLYAFDADIGKEVWYVEVYGDTEEQAKEEAKWIFKRASGQPLNEIKNIRLSDSDRPDGDHNVQNS